MNTLQINSKAAKILSNAATKAREVKPRVRKTEKYGVYEVESSDKSRWYTVTCNSTTKTITCNCKALKPCYHIAAVAPLHSYIARMLQEAAQEAPEPVVWCECGKPAFAHFDGSWWCIDCITKKAQAQENAPTAASAPVVAGVVTTSNQEIERLIEQANEEAQAAQDHDDIFGFVPVRRERIKEEW